MSERRMGNEMMLRSPLNCGKRLDMRASLHERKADGRTDGRTDGGAMRTKDFQEFFKSFLLYVLSA
jgi:hypothetical protein